MPNLHFSEAVALFMLVPSPILSDSLDKRIYSCGGRAGNQPVHQCDAFGDRLVGTMLKGDTWSQMHNAIRDMMFNICKDAGVSVVREPKHLFLNAVPDVHRGTLHRDLQGGIRPDLFASVFDNPRDITMIQRIYDVKTLNSFADHYQGIPTRKFAVDRRARFTQTDYRNNAKKLDARFNATPPLSRGPVEQRLDALGNIFTIAVGRVGEVNKTVLHLLKSCGLQKARAASHHIPMGPAIAQRGHVHIPTLSGYFIDTYMRVFSMFIAYLRADLLIKRKALIGLRPHEQRLIRSDGGIRPQRVS